jgi:hypothetical protein
MFISLTISMTLLLLIGGLGVLDKLGLYSSITKSKGSDTIAIIKEIVRKGEYISLDVNAHLIVRDSSEFTLGPFPIPGTKQWLFQVVPYTMKLGIDCFEIEIDPTRVDTIFITLPPVKVISHEVHFELIDGIDQDGLGGNKTSSKRRDNLIATGLKSSAEVMLNDLRIVRNAQQSFESNFRALFHMSGS